MVVNSNAVAHRNERVRRVVQYTIVSYQLVGRTERFWSETLHDQTIAGERAENVLLLVRRLKR